MIDDCAEPLLLGPLAQFVPGHVACDGEGDDEERDGDCGAEFAAGERGGFRRGIGDGFDRGTGVVRGRGRLGDGGVAVRVTGLAGERDETSSGLRTCDPL